MSCVNCGKIQKFCTECGAELPLVLKDESDAKDERGTDCEEAQAAIQENSLNGIEEKLEGGTDNADEIRRSIPSIHVIDMMIEQNENSTLDGTSVDPFELVTESEVKDALNDDKDRSGLSARLRKLYDRITEWRRIAMHIAVIGESGCGKSTFINTFRGLKSDDKGAAKTGCEETTYEPTPYPHPNNYNLVLWDLPGVGTDSFPKKSYLKKVHFNRYDFIILLSCTRFTQLDAWLAEEIKRRFPEAPLLFVRTKVDSDLAGLNQSRQKPMTKGEQEEEIDRMSHKAAQYITQKKNENYHIYMINCNNPNDFDFGKLVDMLIKNVSAKKREALVLTKTVLTTEVLKRKIYVLQNQMTTVSERAALTAITNKTKGECLEVPILKQTMLEYQYQLGIDNNTINNVAEILKCKSESILDELDSKSHKFISTLVEFYKQNDAIEYLWWDDVPILGRYLKITAYQNQCKRVLNMSFDKCIQDNSRLRDIIRKRMVK